MATLMFEGWDLHQAPYYPHTVTAGIHDYNGFPLWSHGSPSQIYFIDGYQGGKAAVVARNFHTVTTSAGSSPIYRVSFFAKVHDTVGTPPNQEILSVGRNNIERVGLRYINGNLAVYKFSGQLDYTGTSMGGGSAAIGSSWAHYELYVNATDDIVQFYRNKNLIANVSGIGSTANLTLLRLRASAGSDSHSHHIAFDHIVVTDDVTLRDTTGYHGAAVTYQHFGKHTGSELSVRGRILVDETDYFATAHNPGLRGDGGTDGYAPRASNVWYDYWMTNPATGQPWGNTLDIDGWGICRVDNSGGWACFPSAALTYVQMVDGYPHVKWDAPGTPFILEGPWARTNDAVAWNAHVDNYPRTYPPYDFTLDGIDSGTGTSSMGPNPMDSSTWNGYDYDTLFDEDYIGVSGPGCISFGQATEEVEVGTVGFTFAEEFQTSYRDWETVDGVGDDFCSYFISGYKIHGEGNKKFQGNYLTVNFETDTNGSAYVQGIWDYALGNEADDAHSRSDTGRWSQTQQVYGPRNSEDYKHAFSKLKLRGHGKALQLKLKCEAGKPFYINGWAMYVTGNSVT